MINIILFLEVLLGLIISFTGGYLILNRKRHFLIFYPLKQPGLSTFMLVWGTILLVIGILILLLCFFKNLSTLCILLLTIGTICESVLPFAMLIYFPLNK